MEKIDSTLKEAVSILEKVLGKHNLKCMFGETIDDEEEYYEAVVIESSSVFINIIASKKEFQNEYLTESGVFVEITVRKMHFRFRVLPDEIKTVYSGPMPKEEELNFLISNHGFIGTFTQIKDGKD